MIKYGIAAIVLVTLATIGIAWAYTPMLVCFVTSSGVCANVRIDNPLPAVITSP